MSEDMHITNLRNTGSGQPGVPVIATAHLRDTRTGKAAVVEARYADIPQGDYSGVLFHWTGGNYGADGNRADLMDIDAPDLVDGANVIVLERLVANGVPLIEGGVIVWPVSN